MNRYVTVGALLAAFALGLVGRGLMTPAHAAGGAMIRASGDSAVMNQCDFNKTIIPSQNPGTFLCVSK